MQLMKNERDFKGCYMRDEILPNRGCYCLNLDDKSDPGTHWVAVYGDEYYDSYGLPPPKKLSHLKYNTVQHQKPNSSLCGLYACFYIYSRNRNKSAYDICYKIFKINGNEKELKNFHNELLYTSNNRNT